MLEWGGLMRTPLVRVVSGLFKLNDILEYNVLINQFLDSSYMKLDRTYEI